MDVMNGYNMQRWIQKGENMTLLEQLAENGLIGLIPRTADEMTGELHEGDDEAQREEDEDPARFDIYDDESDEDEEDNGPDKRLEDYMIEDYLYHCEEDDEEEYEEDDEEYDDGTGEDEYGSPTEKPYTAFYHKGESERPETLQDLKTVFELEDMSDEEFLALSPADLFGITPGQLKFINLDILLTGSMLKFVDILKSKRITGLIPDVQQRIRYATVCAALKVEKIELPRFYRVELDEDSMPEEYTEDDRRKLEKYIMNLVIFHSEEESMELLRILDDYYYLYQFGYACNVERKREGRNQVRYELFPKPSRLKELHDIAVRDMHMISSGRDEERKQENDRKIADFIKTAAYRRFLKKGEAFSVISAVSCDDLKREGEVLGHCIYSYCDRFADRDSYIYFLRENDNLEMPYFTMEIVLDSTDEYNPRWYLTQCFTRFDTTDKTPECRAFLQDWIKEKELILRCRI